MLENLIFKKVRFQGWLKMAQFLLTDFLGLPTLGSITSDIFSTILQILVPILLQFSWIFQNTPDIYYGISTKTNEKDLKIPNLQPPDWKSPYWMTLYIHGSSDTKG